MGRIKADKILQKTKPQGKRICMKLQTYRIKNMGKKGM